MQVAGNKASTSLTFFLDTNELEVEHELQPYNIFRKNIKTLGNILYKLKTHIAIDGTLRGVPGSKSIRFSCKSASHGMQCREHASAA